MLHVGSAHSLEYAVSNCAPVVRLHYLDFDPEFTEDDVREALRVRAEIHMISEISSEFLQEVTRPILKRMRSAV
jgi:hypothetical protein